MYIDPVVLKGKCTLCTLCTSELKRALIGGMEGEGGWREG